MTETDVDAILPDKVRFNVLFGTVSRALVAVGGLVTSSLLVRSIDISWNISDYANLRVLMYWNSFLLTFVILGLTTAVVKEVAEKAHLRRHVGSVLAVSFVVVTFTFLCVAIGTVFLGDSFGFLVGDTPSETNKLRMLWIIVLLSILPSAYLSIATSFYAGLQRMKQSLYVDFIYNVSRTAIIVLLFFLNQITIENVLYTYLLTTIFGFVFGFYILFKGLKAENVRIDFSEWHAVFRPLIRVGLVFVALGLLASFSSSIVPLLVNYYGTPTDMARYSIADKVVQTMKTFIYAPYAVLLPNIAGMRARGEDKELQERFEESYRIIFPTLIFVTIVTTLLGHFALGTIYGVRALDDVGGLSAAQFLSMMAPLLFVSPVGTIYSNLMVAMDRMKPLLLIGSLSVIFQTVWMIIMQPIFGVAAIANIWIVIIPIVGFYHLYSKHKLALSIPRRFVIKAGVVSLLFVIVTWIASSLMVIIVDNLLSFSIFQYTTIQSFTKLLIVIPLWYVFIGLSLIGGLFRVKDLNNLITFMKIIPPVWWISKPFLKVIERVNEYWIVKRAAIKQRRTRN